MNTHLHIVQSLPSPLHRPAAGARRQRIAGFALEAARVDHFNQVLATVADDPAWLCQDQIASAGRAVLDHADGDACIRERVWRIGLVAHLLNEQDWQPADVAEATGQVLVRYARDRDDLIPDSLARIGRLDDAIVADAAWPRLAAEVDDYLDYRRVRRLEAEVRGCDARAFRFRRVDWLEARAALDAAMTRRQRQVFARSYLPAETTRFRVC
jgi:uncharacterized membrane protein YkvA (DUF1232 family)